MQKKAQKNQYNSLFEYYSFTEADEKECPVISSILKELTPERIKKEIKEVQKVKLPPELQKWVKEYEKVGNRDDFFWKFIYRLNQIINPFNLSDKPIIEIKTLMVILIVLVDDVAEKPQNKELLNVLFEIPYNQNYLKLSELNLKEKKYLEFSIKLWQYIKKNIKKYPGYKKLEEIFDYDVRQVFNAMRYAHLVNRNPCLINKSEHWLYSPHTLQGMVSCILELMYVPKFKTEELGRIREIFLRAQKLARIVNCLGTWKKEINEEDLTNSLFVYAIDLKKINIGEINKKRINKKNIINKIDQSDIKNKLLKEWQDFYNEIRILCIEIKLIDCKKFLSQLEKLSLIYLIAGRLTK